MTLQIPGQMALAAREGSILCKTKTMTLPTAESVTDDILDRFGPGKVWQVERLGNRIFRVWLTCGAVALATVGQDGGLTIQVMEGWV